MPEKLIPANISAQSSSAKSCDLFVFIAIEILPSSFNFFKTSKIPSNGLVFGLGSAKYTSRYFSFNFEIISAVRSSSPTKLENITSKLPPTMCLYSSSEWVLRPKCSKTLLKHRPASTMVSIKVPSKSKITSFFIIISPTLPSRFQIAAPKAAFWRGLRSPSCRRTRICSADIKPQTPSLSKCQLSAGLRHHRT